MKHTDITDIIIKHNEGENLARNHILATESLI